MPSSDGEESDDSLEDPFETLRRQRRKIEPASGVKKMPSRAATPPSLRTPSAAVGDPPVRSYKFSLENLIAQKDRDTALEKEKLAAKALHEEANREITTDFRNGEQEIDEAMMIEAFGEVEARKLMAALKRKDAWRVDKTWHFFDLERDKRRNPFPRHAVEGGGWEAGLVTARGRRQMFLSGFVTDMAKIDAVLPDEVLSWMLDEVCLETKDELAFAYFRVLGALPIPVVEQQFTEERVFRLFHLLGGKVDALDTEKQVVLADSGRIDDQDGNFYNARLVTTFFGRIAPYICSNTAVVKKTCVLLVRLALDVRVARQAQLRASIEDALAELFESIPDGDWAEVSKEIALNLITTILDTPYRLRAVNALPVHTPRTHLFRRRLALSYLWDDPSYLTKPYADLVRISDLDKLLVRPQYEITKETDYHDLKAHASMLDIAIDDGPTAREDHEDNDGEIDILVERLRNLFGRINDTNAQNLTRTEAKDTIERLNFRLRFAVRTKVKTQLVVDTDTGPEWVGRDGKVQTRLPWVGGGGGGGGEGGGSAGDN